MILNSPDMETSSQKRSVLFVATVSSFLTPFMVSAINVTLPAIQSEFHLNAIILAWIPTLYLLSYAVFILPCGKIADIFGRKKVFICGIWVFTVSSALAAMSPTTPVLLLSRVTQGMGSSMIFPTSLAILADVFPSHERGKAIGISVAAVYMGLSTGPFLGGVLTNHLTWRAVFVAPIPVGIAAIYLSTWKLAGEWVTARGEKIDLVGSILYGAAIVFFMYGVSVLPSSTSLWAICLGLAFGGSFVWWERKAPSPVVNLDLFSQNKVFALSSLAALINSSATFAVAFLLSLYLQYIKGLTSQTSGLALMALPLVMAIFSPVAGRLSDRLDPGKIASLGMAVTAIGLFAMIFLKSRTSMLFIVSDLGFLGLGVALFASPNMNTIMNSVERKFYGTAAGISGSVRLLGNMLSMGIVTVVFSMYLGRVPITPQHYPAFLKSLKTGFLIFTLLCFAGVFATIASQKDTSVD
jgi:EmrB/QacA subfamily drug resistance transporter